MEAMGWLEVQLLSLSLPPPSELCQDWVEEWAEVPSKSIMNEGLLKEAWEVINESFIGIMGNAINHSWSPNKWLIVNHEQGATIAFEILFPGSHWSRTPVILASSAPPQAGSILIHSPCRARQGFHSPFIKWGQA